VKVDIGIYLLGGFDSHIIPTKGGSQVTDNTL
jgi:hypothetical protein